MDVSAAETVDALESAIQTLGALAVAYSLSLVGAIVVLVLGYLFAGLVSRWVHAGLSRFHGFDLTLRQFFANIARYAVLVLVGITVLAQFGVQTASILAAIGAIGLAIGLALQGTLQNIAAGIMLLVLRPFRVGEYIEAGEVKGTVVDIGLFATELRSGTGLYVLSPNNELWKTPVVNFSRNPTRMHDIVIGIGYGDDVDLARKTLLDLAEADPRPLKDPPPSAFVSNLGESTVEVTLRYWAPTSQWWQTRLDLTEAAKKAFDAKGISMPSPQRDVHLFTERAAEPKPPVLQN